MLTAGPRARYSPQMVPARRAVNPRALLGLAALLGLSACSYLPPLPERPRNVFTIPITNRGHAVTEDEIRQLTPGVSTRADVQAALGSPSHSGTFSDEAWYYISSVTRQRPGQTLGMVSQRVVVAEFDRAGVLRRVGEVDPREMRSVAMVGRETPTPGTERTLLQALFGNVGRVGPQIGQQTGPGFGPTPSGR